MAAREKKVFEVKLLVCVFLGRMTPWWGGSEDRRPSSRPIAENGFFPEVPVFPVNGLSYDFYMKSKKAGNTPVSVIKQTPAFYVTEKVVKAAWEANRLNCDSSGSL